MFFSIIVPVYNAEKYLSECIESILGQSFDDYELILIDDGSKDISKDICDEYARKDSRIKVIHKNNEGVSITRQRGVEFSRGEYLCFADADDKLDKHCLESFYLAIKKYNCDMVCAGYIRFNGESRKKVSLPAKSGVYDKADLEKDIYPRLICDRYDKSFSDSVWGKAVKSSLYRENQLTDVKVIMGEDGACIKPCIYHAKRICILDEQLYLYRETEVSATGAGRVRNWEEPLIIERHLRQHINADVLDFEDQINRSTAHALFNTAVSQYSSDKPRSVIDREVRTELKKKEYKTIIKKARFDSAKGKICVLALRFRLTYLFYLRWKQNHR